MSFRYPLLLLVAVLVTGALAAGYRLLARDRSRALAAAGLRAAGPAWRRHLPPLLFLAALGLLVASLARPQATVTLPRVAGTVVLAMDVSASMTATDAQPTRLAAAQAAATGFIRDQPSTVDIGVVAFDQGALATQQPTGGDHAAAIAAVAALHPSGGTSLGQAILAALSTIVGKTVPAPDADSDTPPRVDYHGSATIVVFSDGEDTSGPDALAAAEVAAAAGVHIETVGIGTTAGTTVRVDGYQVATALDEELLTGVAQTTSGSYHRAGDPGVLAALSDSVDLRITTRGEAVELTGAVALVAVLLLTVGGILMTLWFGRIL
jgi:Ca-activated chloride channel family protein